jgi:hypothetical protein
MQSRPEIIGSDGFGIGRPHTARRWRPFLVLRSDFSRFRFSRSFNTSCAKRLASFDEAIEAVPVGFVAAMIMAPLYSLDKSSGLHASDVPAEWSGA